MTDADKKKVIALVETQIAHHTREWLKAQPWYQEEQRRIIALFEGREPDPPSEEYISVYGEWTRDNRTTPRPHI